MLRTIAQLFSIIFHPLLMLTYMLVILLLVNPYLFGVHDIKDMSPLILIVFMSTFIIPSFAVVMMKFLGFVDSLEMQTRQERIAPYIATGIFYLWMFINLYYNPNIPIAYKSFVLGATIALFLAFFINIFSKISLHAVGMGGLIAMIVITTLLFSYGTFNLSLGGSTYILSMNLVLMMGLLLSGVVCTARLVLDAHNLQDLYGGFIVGFGAQFLALKFLL